MHVLARDDSHRVTPPHSARNFARRRTPAPASGRRLLTGRVVWKSVRAAAASHETGATRISAAARSAQGVPERSRKAVSLTSSASCRHQKFDGKVHCEVVQAI